MDRKPAGRAPAANPFRVGNPLGAAALEQMGRQDSRAASAGDAARRRVIEQATQAAVNDRVKAEHATAAAQDSERFRRIVLNRVSSTAGLAPAGHPFTGTPTKAPAHDPYVPDLTAEVLLAKANRTRLQGNPLLPVSPDENWAATTVRASSSPSFAESHQLPSNLTRPATSLSHDEANAIIRSVYAGHPIAPAAPTGHAPVPRETGAPASLIRQAPPGRPSGPHTFGPFTTDIHSPTEALANVSDWANKLFGTAASAGLAGIGVGSPDILTKQTSEKNLVGLADPLSRISHAGYGNNAPPVPLSSLQDGAAYAKRLASGFLSGGVQSSFASNGLPVNQLPTGWGLTPQAAAGAIKLAQKRGWRPIDTENQGGADLWRMAYNDPPPWYTQVLKGVGRDAILFGATVPGVLGLATQAASGDPGGAAKGLGDALTQFLPGYGRHDFISNLEHDPLFTATGITAGLKGAGGIGGRVAAAAGRKAVAREVGISGLDHPGHFLENGDHTPLKINRGEYDRNLYTAAGQHLADLWLAHGPSSDSKLGPISGARRSGKGVRGVDQAVREEWNRLGPEFSVLQRSYINAYRAVKAEGGNSRPEQLLGLHEAGSPADARRVAQMFEHAMKTKQATGEANPGELQRQVDFWNGVADATAQRSPVDEAFLTAHENLSRHTSGVKSHLGEFSPAAMLYRQHQTLVESKAYFGDPLAQEVLRRRNEWEARRGSSTPPAEGSPAFLARVSEIERTAHAHGRSAASIGEKLAADTAEIKDWRTKRTEINARRPVLEVAPKEAPAVAPRGPITREPEVFKFSNKSDARAFLNREIKQHNTDNPDPKLKASGELSQDGKKTIVTITRPRRGKAKAAPKAKPTALPTHTPEGAPIARDRKTHSANLRTWEAEKQAHAAAQPKHPGAKARGTRKRTHETAQRQGEKRLGDLTEAQRERVAKRGTAEDLYAAYLGATQAFAQHHLDNGGIAPARVARTVPSSKVSNPFAKRDPASIRFSDKPTVHEHFSSGSRFKGGNFIIDAQVPVRESIAAMRLASSHGVFHAVSEKHGHRLEASTEERLAPRGWRFVSDRNLRVIKATHRDLTDEPVGAHDFYQHEHSLREKLYTAMQGAHSEKIPAHESGMLIPTAMHERIMEWTRPTGKSKYDRFNRQYQRALIGLYPSTLLGNTVGTLPLAYMSSLRAMSPEAHQWALRSGPDSVISRGLGHEKDTTLSPHSLSGAGQGGMLASDARNVASGFLNYSRGLSVRGEDFARRVAYFGKALPYIKSRAKELEISAEEYAQALASGHHADGEALSATEMAMQNKFLDHVERFVGDLHKPQGEMGRWIGRGILFHNWMGHILKLSLFTLPVMHPGRGLILNALSSYGEDYRKQHGVWPSWMTQFFPLYRSEQLLAGRLVPVVNSVGTGQLGPIGSVSTFGTALQEDKPLLSRFADIASPPVAYGLNLAVEGVKNSVSHSPTSLLRLAAGQAPYLFPGFAKFVPRSGNKPTSIPFFSPQHRDYYYINPRNGQKVPIPFDLRYGARPWTGFLGTASRIAGLPLESNPTGGLPVSSEINKAEFKNLRDYVGRLRQGGH